MDEELKKDWELFWGEAPPGSLKHKRGKEILRFIQTAVSKAKREGYKECLKELDEMWVNNEIDIKPETRLKLNKLLTQKK